MESVFKFMGGFFKGLTQLLISFAALAVLAEVRFWERRGGCDVEMDEDHQGYACGF